MAKIKQTGGGDRSYGRTDVTRENYSELAQQFIRNNGGEGVVIRAVTGTKGSAMSGMSPTEPQWAAWMAYFVSKGIPTVFVRSHGLATVPSPWPEDFDLTAPVSDRSHVEPVVAQASRAYAAGLAAKFRDLARTNGPFDPLMPRRPSPDEIRVQALQAVAGGFDGLAKKPLPVSDVLRRQNEERAFTRDFHLGDGE